VATCVSTILLLRSAVRQDGVMVMAVVMTGKAVTPQWKKRDQKAEVGRRARPIHVATKTVA
jgi:hypothetical protein